MSEFEFVFTGVTIVLALAIARLLEGLRDTVDRNRRYWIHLLWIANRLLFALGIFWSAFGARQRTDQDFFFFLIVITPPAVLFLQANALVTPQPGAIEDWKEHFWSIRKWFFGSNMLLLLGVFLISAYRTPVGGGPIAFYGPLAIGLLLSIVGYRSSSERVHGVLATIAFFLVASGFARLAVPA